MQPANGDQAQQPHSEPPQDSLSDDVIEILDSPVKKSALTTTTLKTRRSPSKSEIQMAPVFSQMAASTTQASANLKRKRSSVDEPISRDFAREEKHKESKWKSGGQASEPSSIRTDPLKAVQP